MAVANLTGAIVFTSQAANPLSVKRHAYRGRGQLREHDLKAAALLSGIIASAIAWAASYFVLDLSAQFLTLWPQTISQQFLGLIVWHCIVASALVGGVLAVFSPIFGGLLMLGAAAAWAYLGTRLPAGFSPQVAVPLAFAAIGGLAAFGATFRGLARRRAMTLDTPLADSEEVERQEALRFEPTEDLARAVEAKGRPTISASDADEAIVPVAGRRPDEAPRGMSGMVIANGLLLMLLTIGVAVLLYADYRSGELTAAFSTLPFEPLPPAPAAAATAPAADAAAAAATAPAEAVATTDVRVASQPLDITALPPQNWSDPFDYCRGVGTVDYPDRRYSGPVIPTAVSEALHVSKATSPDRLKWRCADGALLGCASFRGPSCALTPSVTEMLEYCAQNPNAEGLMAPGGTWKCNDTEPEITGGERWPVDGRGFLPGAWVEITRPGV